MISTQKEIRTVQATIQAPVDKVWDMWTDPKHIIHWNKASEDWFTPFADNDLRVGGQFVSRMEARDGSWGFDFGGQYTRVQPFSVIEYTIGDGRKVQVNFQPQGNTTLVTEKFETEQVHSSELQQQGWQAIMDNFKKHVENSEKFEKLHFEITIRNSPEKVYRTMISKELWSEWTAAFDPSSQFKGNWEKGSEMRFLGTDKEGLQGGMISKVVENIPNKYICLEHFAVINKGEELHSGPDIDSWKGARESYYFKEVEGGTLLIVNADSNPQHKSYFENTWPLALQKLKEICER